MVLTMNNSDRIGIDTHGLSEQPIDKFHTCFDPSCKHNVDQEYCSFDDDECNYEPKECKEE